MALHFERSPSDYKRYRPTYPPKLFAYLASLVPSHGTAWDCGTGNGQAAVGLAEHFRNVIATDASTKQLGEASAHDGVEYRVAPAEDSGIAARSIDLVTVAQALHWFDLERFYAEVRRVAKPGCVLVAWGYTMLRIAPEIDCLVDRFYLDVVGPYWPKERVHVEAEYRDLPFPFEALPSPPPFAMKLDWNLADLVGYVGTWSPVRIFVEQRGFDPVPELAGELAAPWGDPERRRTASWPLFFRVGRVASG